ncbi:hypothetical protein BCR32DRAFT_270946 [Anaeromyces robustus]|uniref:RING-type domain-containing protein n=1 Tax=Anaeromyces robustus TaxID=1754192 RepID=A0A1Y1WTU6_9FUNG|nr:hypothetical protein BCR32DRAFT_270946 [Anaeromyces robustus]|eukprot:ORX76959.1 hypothetical protein BCR32DRAFT_270946 [Anaeromyces robustus]
MNANYHSNKLLVLVYLIIIILCLQWVNGNRTIYTYNSNDNDHNIYDITPVSTVKSQRVDYEQIQYFYDLWVNTYFKKKNNEITCDNIMKYLTSKKDIINIPYNKKHVNNQDFKIKKTFDVCHYFEKYIRSTRISGFNETFIDKDTYDSTSEYLYYVWVALSNPQLKKLITYDFMDDIKCPINDIFLISLITYSILLTFGFLYIMLKRHYNRTINQLRLKHQRLSEKQLNQIEVKTLTEKDIECLNINNNTNGSHELCGICREIYIPNDKIRILYCNHIFHKNCIDNWFLYYNNCCPYCKSDISKKLIAFY